MKRIVCVILAAACVFFTGCNSIIYNGDFRFQSFEPETVPPVYDELKEELEEEDTIAYEKYQIEGTQAFYILPGHDNYPDEIIDFQVLDYTEDGTFIYSYLTPCEINNEISALGGTPKEGIAPESREFFTVGKDAKYNALVLMSYNPETREYKVFYSRLAERDKTKEAVNKKAAGQDDVGELRASAENSSIMCGRLVKSNEYYIFHEQTAYVFNQKGEELSRTDYSVIISQEAERLKEKAVKELESKLGDKAKELAKDAAVTVSDVVMDGDYFVYIPITVELEAEEKLENIEDDLNTVFMAVIAGYNLELDGSIKFVAQNENWKKQIELWEDPLIDSKAEDHMDEDGVFGGPGELEDFLKRYSMDRIKSGKAGYEGTAQFPDDFSAFHTDGSVANMELAAIPDIFSGVELYKMSSEHKFLRTETVAFADLAKNSQTLMRFLRAYYPFFYWIGNYPFAREAFWDKTTAENRELLVTAAIETLTQMAQGRTNDNTYYLIPWLCPGPWDEKNQINQKPLSPQRSQVPIVLAYKTSLYDDGGIIEMNQYTNIRIKDQFANGNNVPKFEIKVSKWSEEQSERTFEYRGKNGDEMSVTETLDQYPVEYELVFPEGSSLSWVEEIDSDEMVAASGELGAIYYKELEAKEGEARFSRIRYNDGQKDILSDEAMPGRAMDAGMLYYTDTADDKKETEIVVFMTDEGVRFYKKEGGIFVEKAYMELEELSRAAASYGLSKSGGETETEKSDAEELEVTGDQDKIIREKSEEGRATSLFSASAFSLLNEKEAIASSLSGGLTLVNIENGLAVSLKSGAYYRAFPYTESRESGRKFMVVGYDTEEYYYEPGDIAWAKCYSMDLEAENARLEEEAVMGYLDGLVHEYLTRTHRLIWSEKDKKYQIQKSTAEEKEANRQVEALFYEGSEASKSWELEKLTGKLGFGYPSERVRNYAQELSQKLLKQRQYLTAFYRTAGLGLIDGIPGDAWLLEIEGSLISAYYTEQLETALVEIRLSDQAISRMKEDTQEQREKKEQYREYQKQLQAAKLTINRAPDELEFEPGKLIDSIQDGEAVSTGKDRSAIEQMACYNQVLADVKEETVYSDWNRWLKELLNGISPDHAVDQQEQGLQLFCELAGISQEMLEMPNMQDLPEKLSGLRRVRELEELIIECRLNGAAYQSSPFRQEYKNYKEQTFASEAEQEEVFQSGGFYQIIQDVKDAQEENLTAQEWEKKLKNIIGLCGAGIVLNTEN